MDQYVGEIRTFAFNQIPRGWLPCEGQTLAVQGNQALYSLLGTAFGGNPGVNFKLPDLRGRVTMNNGHTTVQNSNAQYTIGNTGGVETVALTATQVPSHTHTVNVFNGNANALLADGNAIAQKQQTQALTNENINAFAAPPKPPDNPLVPLHPKTVAVTGGAPHENRMPFISLQVCISTSGIYPTRP